MKYTKRQLLSEAISIAKEYARSGNSGAVHVVLEDVYKKLLELNEDLKDEQ